MILFAVWIVLVLQHELLLAVKISCITSRSARLCPIYHPVEFDEKYLAAVSRYAPLRSDFPAFPKYNKSVVSTWDFDQNLIEQQ